MKQRDCHNKLIFTMPGTFLIWFPTKIMTKKDKVQNNKQRENKKEEDGTKPLVKGFITSMMQATTLDKISGKTRLPVTPKSKIGRWCVFALCVASSLIGGFVVPFYSVQDCV